MSANDDEDEDDDDDATTTTTGVLTHHHHQLSSKTMSSLLWTLRYTGVASGREGRYRRHRFPHGGEILGHP